ncbi:TonB-dependent receptor [Croceibacter atlanticus]|uniref:TonB-dependent receptor n=1 Tax=Croceibacter atlanticus TaxID=313588 RepID=UPI003CD0E23F
MRHLLFLLLVLTNLSLFGQTTFTLNGTIRDASSNETLNGVNVIINELQTGTVTNTYGFYSISIPEGNYTITLSYLGYNTTSQNISITTKTTLNFSLTESSETLDTVVIKEDVERTNIRSPQMSVNSLSIKTIKQIPVVLGEPDIIKSILLLPGVTNAGEGASGFNVRGGAADQNLILLDEATIYNSSHLFGLFSIFNPDAIKDIKLYKGGIPSKYGGRVSSVLDIYQKDGNSKKFSAEGGLGILSSRLLVEGPIQKERSSFLLAGRSSYAHLFLKLTDNENLAYFYDLNTKLSYKLDDKNTLLLSGYFGRDVFNLNDSFKNVYGNSILNLRWNHVFSDNVFTNLSVIYSDYYYGLELDLAEFKYNSGIRNGNIKYGFNHYINNDLKLNYGIQNTLYEFNPGEIEPSTTDSGINAFTLTKKYALESGIYLSAEHNLTEKLTAEYGLRYSAFFRLGQDRLFTYENNLPVIYNQEQGVYESANPIGEENFNRDNIIKSFGNLEPRVSLSYLLNDQSSIKLSYNRIAQYIHILSNTSSPTPLDVYTPSGKFVEPQIVDQVAAGYFKNFNENEYSLEFEAFYKYINNRIDYIDGTDLIANDAIEQVILNGKARAYGLEVLFRKNLGKFQGWLSYTLSKSEQKTPGRSEIEPGISNGNWYLTNYDKTHDISITTSYKLNDKWTFSGNFLLQTGQPTTFPTSQYQYEGQTIPVYGERNTDRLPLFNRLDIAAEFTPNPNNDKRWQSYWSFGIYNLYNRKNAASISFRENRTTGVNEAVRFSIFGIVPSISYNFKY